MTIPRAIRYEPASLAAYDACPARLNSGAQARDNLAMAHTPRLIPRQPRAFQVVDAPSEVPPSELPEAR